AMKAFKGSVEAAKPEKFKNLDPEIKKIWDRKYSFSDGNRLRFGAWRFDEVKKFDRETMEEYVKKLEEGDEEVKNWGYTERL
ncbi:14934_t:CDS:1, partial [Racocetra persica]